MFDIVFVGTNEEQFTKLKQKVFIAKKADSVEKAQQISLTKFLWIVYDDLEIANDFEFDYTPDDWSQDIAHVFLNNTEYDGISLIPKHVTFNKNELSHRFYVQSKEVEIIASNPIKYDHFYVDTYDEYLHAMQTSKTEMFWVDSRNIKSILPDIYFTHHDTYNRKENHAFIHDVNERILYNGLFLCSTHKSVTEKEINFRHLVSCKQWDTVGSGPIKYAKYYPIVYEDYLDALQNSPTEMFWIIPSYVNPTARFAFDTYFTHDQTYDRKINHAYLNGKYHDGIVLCSKSGKFSRREFDYKFIANKKEVNIAISTPKPYDIVFISYQEPNADENYERILERFPQCKRVHGVKGIHQAHIAGAKLCNTELFWIIDGDATIVDDFKFDYQVARWDKEMVHVWRSQNPINDMVYGYGGVKLFPTDLTINMDTSKPDMTTSISSKFKAVHDISNITAFNTDAFNSFKSAFRECTKLASKVIDRQKNEETEDRLRIWTTVGKERPYGEYAIKGAREGAAYGMANQGNTEALKKINDFDWLKEKFNGNI